MSGRGGIPPCLCLTAVLVLCALSQGSCQELGTDWVHAQFNLTAAWQAALERGPVPATDIPWPASFFAVRASNVSLAAAVFYQVDLPMGNWSLEGSITVQAGQVLVLQGVGGLLRAESRSTPGPRSVWVMEPGNGSTTAANITLLPGAVAYLRNVTLVGPSLGSLDGPAAFVPAAFTLPADQPQAAAYILEYSAVILPDCAQLEAMQLNVCNMILQDSDTPWPTAEQEPGWLFMFLLQSRTGNATMNGCLYVCDWPPPPLLTFGWGLSATPSNQQDAAPLLGTALMNASLVALTPQGLPADGRLVGTFPSSSTPRMPCAVRRVLDSQQLMRAVVELQAMSSQHVVIQLARNVTLRDVAANASAIWPRTNTALRVYRNVTIYGRHALVARVTELDFGLLRNIFWLDSTDTSILRLQQLTLSNMPCGPRESFPMSQLVMVAWPVAWNRTSGARVFVEVKNSTIIQPQDNFNYSTYWVGISASPIPSVRQQGDWQSNLNFQGTLAVSNDSHTLFLQRRWGMGIQWTNTSFTDLPDVYELMPTNCGLTQLMPGDPYYPYSYITPVYDAQQLTTYLQSPPTPALMLMTNLSLPAPPVATTVNLSAGVTVLGWWEGDTLLDLSNTPGMLQLNPAAGQQLSLQRVVLTGLGAAGAAQQPQRLANLTSMLWAFDFTRSALIVLSLANVSLVVPPAELAMLVAYTSQPGTSQPGMGVSGPGSGAPSSLQDFYSNWNAARVQAASNDSLNISQVVWYGVQGRDMRVTSQLPASLAALSLATPTPQGLLLPNAAAAGSSGSGKELSAWQVALLVVGCALAAAVVAGGLAVWWGTKRRRQLTLAHKAELDACQQPHLSSSNPAGAEEEGDNSSHHLAVAVEVPVPGQPRGSASASTPPSSLGAASAARRQPATHLPIPPPFPVMPDSTAGHSSSGGASITGDLSQTQLVVPSTGGMQDGGYMVLTQPPRQASDKLSSGKTSSDRAAAASMRSTHAGTQLAADDSAQHAAAVVAAMGPGPEAFTQQEPQVDQGHAGGLTQAGGPAQLAGSAGNTVTVQLVSSGELLTSGTATAAGTGTSTSGAAVSGTTLALAGPSARVVRGSHGVQDLVQQGVIQLGTLGPSLSEVATQHAGTHGAQALGALDVGAAGAEAGAQATAGTQRATVVADAAAAAAAVDADAGKADAPGLERESGPSSAGRRPPATPLLEEGLVAGEWEGQPAEVLQQVIAQRKLMQGIDMQQVTFQQVLGQGSYGVVYKGKWRSLTVAIKTLMFQDAGAAKRIRQRAITEAAINTLLTHDNIVNTFAYDLRAVVGSNMPDERHAACWKLYIISEFCNAGSLAQAVDRGVFVDSKSGFNKLLLTLQVAHDIARGMAYIHDNNVIHGDLSSSNVLLRHDPARSQYIAKVGDFGLSRFLEGPNHSHISNVRQGTPFYIAPEVLNQGVMSKPADVFSFGVLLWEMFCGKPPWRDSALGRCQINPLHFPYHVPTNCPAEYHQLILACLADNPKARPTFHQLLPQIERMLSTLREVVSVHAVRAWFQQQQPAGQATAQSTAAAAAAGAAPEQQPQQQQVRTGELQLLSPQQASAVLRQSVRTDSVQPLLQR